MNKIQNWIGLVVLSIVIAFVVLFPLTATIVAMCWTTMGIAAYGIWSRKNPFKGNWRLCDTAVCIVFALFGPLSLFLVFANDRAHKR